MDATRRQVFMLLNASTAPWWLAMILLPRSRLTSRLVDRVPLVLAGPRRRLHEPARARNRGR